MSEDLPRMRIYRGRVMHKVVARGSGRNLWYGSQCTRPHPVKGVSGTLPRADGPADIWEADNPLEYPDCTHCPPDPQPRTADELPRMRARNGRVMHRVQPHPARRGWLRSWCSKPTRLKNAPAMVPAATGPAHEWTKDQGEYPDCGNCPPETSQETS